MKLRGRLTLYILVFTAVLVTMGVLLTISFTRNALHSSGVVLLDTLANEKQGALDEWFFEKKVDITRLASGTAIAESARVLMEENPNSPEAEKAAEELIQNLQTSIEAGEFDSLFLLDPRIQKVIATTNPTELGNGKEETTLFMSGAEGPYLHQPYYSYLLKAPSIFAAAPMASTQGKQPAILVGRIDLTQMNAIINRRTGIHQTDDAYLINASGSFVSQPRHYSTAVVLQEKPNTEAAQLCESRSSGTVDGTDYRNMRALIVYRWLPEQGLCLIVKIDEAEIYSPIQEFNTTLFLDAILAFTAAAGLGIWIAYSLTRPINIMKQRVASLERGEWTAALPETARDELGDLAREFNRMTTALAAKDSVLHQDAEALSTKVKERTAELLAAENELRKLNVELEERIRARTNDLEATNKELAAFTYSVSHDLRAPLRHVSGFVELLSRSATNLDEKSTRYVDTISKAAERMGVMIDDLLNFSRTGRTELKTAEVDMETLVREVIDELNDSQLGRDIQWEIAILPSNRGDRALLKLVFMNLISNAIKFTRDRSPAKIEIGYDASDPDKLVYFVKDNGVGFDMRYADKLFGIFQRLHREEEFEGTGIGLANVQRIIHRHGGSNWAEAELDHGATFFFNLNRSVIRSKGEPPKTVERGKEEDLFTSRAIELI